MRKSIIATIVAVGLLSSPVFAATSTQTTNSSELTPTQIQAVDNIARIGNEAMQDVQLARVALFNGNTSNAKKLLVDADKKINDDKTDWSSFVKKNKKTPIDGDQYVIINASMSVSEDFQPTDKKTKAIKEANDKLKKGDKKGAMETLKLAGITVVENQVLMPLKQTRNDIQEAIKLFNDGKYYQTNLLLLSAEQGLIVDTELMSD
ncbi:YfdX family protein [Salmonella enterica]|nr:YfdX family protein [Salmonella enterica]EIE7938936.1 YfdX family protein [Salmonella enterica]